MTMKRALLLFSLLFFVATDYPQVITTIPKFPTENDSIIVYFDATKGDQGLMGFNGTVYAHTGVLTDSSTSSHDWRYVLTNWPVNVAANTLVRDSANHYHLVIGYPRDYYDKNETGFGTIPSSEHIKQLAFVFRNSDGSITGRDVGGADIFAPIYKPGINLTLLQPTLDVKFDDPLRSPYFIGPNDSIRITYSAISIGTKISSFKILVNNLEVTQSNSDTLSYLFLSSNYHIGANYVSAVATDTSGLADTSTFVVYINPPVPNKPLPSGIEYGINYVNNSTVTLSLFAPYKKFVYVIGDFNNWEVDSTYYMNKQEITPDSVIWWITITGLTAGQEYAFQYLVDGKIRIADPYTEKVLDPINDKYISSQTYPNLKPYPAGKTEEIVSVLQTDQTPYNWIATNFKRPNKSNLVIYELLVRDFVSTHDYNTLTDTLGYLKRLGINAIELMPIMEFEGNDSWGYNPDFDFAPDKYYGTKDDLKKFIDSAHQDSIAVILDSPMNDIFNSSPLARLYWDTTNNRPAANNPWLNPIPKHPYNVGNDFNYGSSAMKYYIDRFTKFWLTQYHVDGFRFDLSKGYTQTYSGNNVNLWGQYDQSRINNLERIANKIWGVDSSAYVILEHFADNNEETVLANYGMMLWGNMNGNYQQATMGYPSGAPGTWDLTWGYYVNRGWAHPNLVSYMESHDEERLMYKNINYGNSYGSYNIKNLSTAIQRIKLAAAFFFPIPGPKMIWQFGELGYDYSINYNSRVGDKPIRWDYYSDLRRYNLYQVFSALIKLKEKYPVFKNGTVMMSLADTLKRIVLIGSSMSVDIIGNFGVKQSSINPNFPYSGNWYDYFSGDTLNVVNSQNLISLAPGEFHVYTTKKLPTPPGDIISGISSNSIPGAKDFKLLQNYPNPFNPTTRIVYAIPKSSFVKLKIYDILGRVVKTLVNRKEEAGKYSITWNGDDESGSKVSSGVYFCKIEAGKFKSVRKMVMLK